MLEVLEDAAVITAAFRIAVARGEQLGVVDVGLEAREEEVVAHEVDQVHVVCLHVVPKGVVGR